MIPRLAASSPTRRRRSARPMAARGAREPERAGRPPPTWWRRSTGCRRMAPAVERRQPQSWRGSGDDAGARGSLQVRAGRRRCRPSRSTPASWSVNGVSRARAFLVAATTRDRPVLWRHAVRLRGVCRRSRMSEGARAARDLLSLHPDGRAARQTALGRTPIPTTPPGTGPARVPPWRGRIILSSPARPGFAGTQRWTKTATSRKTRSRRPVAAGSIARRCVAGRSSALSTSCSALD